MLFLSAEYLKLIILRKSYKTTRNKRVHVRCKGSLATVPKFQFNSSTQRCYDLEKYGKSKTL